MKASLETWMSYWLQPHTFMYGERDVKEGATLWAFTHESTDLEIIEVLGLLIEDHPHLTNLLNDFEYVRLNRTIIDPDALLDSVEGEDGERLMRLFVESECVTVDNQTIWNEFLEGKTKAGSLLSRDTDPSTHALIMNAYDETCRIHKLSQLMESDKEIMSVSGGFRGSEPKLQKMMGSKMIESELAEFRKQLESWLPGGGES